VLIAKFDSAAIFRLSKGHVALVLHWALEATILPNFRSILYCYCIAISITFAIYFYSVTFNLIHTCYPDSETKYF